jgi:hypothetical protein
MAKSVTFLPAFGNRPARIIGRKDVMADFTEGLSLPVGHQKRASILIGQRGTGKTALLLEFAEIAAGMDCVVARVTASNEMLEEIIQTIQANGARFIPEGKAKIKGFSAGAMGFSFGLTFTEKTEAHFGFRVKLGLLCDELAQYGKKVLILVDEVQSNTPEMRSLATTYQHLVGENRDIAIVMAGLPSAMSMVLNDDILTFLNRAHKTHLQPLPFGEIAICYATEFSRQGKRIEPETLEAAVVATRGYPYLFQLVGYYITELSAETDEIGSEVVTQAIANSQRDMVDSIFNTALRAVSPRDMDFLKAMAQDSGDSRMSAIRSRMGVSQPYAQKYRTRLIEAGLIAAARRGEVTFVLPYLGEYLRGEFFS